MVGSGVWKHRIISPLVIYAENAHLCALSNVTGTPLRLTVEERIHFSALPGRVPWSSPLSPHPKEPLSSCPPRFRDVCGIDQMDAHLFYLSQFPICSSILPNTRSMTFSFSKRNTPPARLAFQSAYPVPCYVIRPNIDHELENKELLTNHDQASPYPLNSNSESDLQISIMARDTTHHVPHASISFSFHFMDSSASLCYIVPQSTEVSYRPF